MKTRHQTFQAHAELIRYFTQIHFDLPYSFWIRDLRKVWCICSTFQKATPNQVGCLKMDRILRWLSPHEKLDCSVFGEYLRDVLGLPIGTERLRWNRESLREYDERLVAINLAYRERIIDMCFEIIEKYKNDKTTTYEEK